MPDPDKVPDGDLGCSLWEVFQAHPGQASGTIEPSVGGCNRNETDSRKGPRGDNHRLGGEDSLNMTWIRTGEHGVDCPTRHLDVRPMWDRKAQASTPVLLRLDHGGRALITQALRLLVNLQIYRDLTDPGPGG